MINDALDEYLAQVEAGQVVDGGEVMEWIDSWGSEVEKEPSTV